MSSRFIKVKINEKDMLLREITETVKTYCDF
jgi:hypothetical protein